MHRIDSDINRYLWIIGGVFNVFLLLGCSASGEIEAVFEGVEKDRWQIQLSGPVNTNYNVDTYIIDLFDSSEQLIVDLKGQGVEVICYFSAGSAEDWRVDADMHTDADKGKNLLGWVGEKWLDIRSPSVRMVTKNRLDFAVKKGCDGVDPDNVNGYENDTGFDITREDQLVYNKFIVTEGHKLGLLVGLKNTLELIPELFEEFDFAVNEECFEFQECRLLEPFIDAAKPVFFIEYAKDEDAAEAKATNGAVCEQSKGLELQRLIMPVLLDDSFRVVCK